MTEIRITDLNVEEVMTRDLGLVKQDTPICDVVDLMVTNNWEEVLITDDNNKFIDIVTRKSLLQMIKEGVEQHRSILSICSHKVITTSPDVPLIKARTIMRENKIGRLPVIDNDERLIGVLTARDVCNGFSSKLEMLGEHMYSIMENISEAIQVIDCQGVVTYWNYAAEKMFSIKAADVMGKNLSEFMPDDILLKVISTLEPSHDFLMELKGGTSIIRNAVPVIFSNGDIIGAVCTSMDITHTKNLINKLDNCQLKLQKLERFIDSNESAVNEHFYTVNPATMRVLQQAYRVANSGATVLITGESGTGKELMAKYIYRNSNRNDKPFIEVNCGAIPESLFESEMFGYESGAFTGALKSGKPGKFELARTGTMFLDEVGELPLEMQAKFLRILQEKTFYRVGGKFPVTSEVRILAATNRDIKKLVEENRFRKDLFYRLSVVVLSIPPLRERKEDVPGLIQLFIKQLNLQYGKSIGGVDPDVIRIMTDYSWPGNVRQLHNLLESIFILSDGVYITEKSLQEAGVDNILYSGEVNLNGISDNTISGNHDPFETNTKLYDFIDTHEKKVILEVLKNCHYNKSQAAQILGIPRSTLYYKMKALGIQGDEKVTLT